MCENEVHQIIKQFDSRNAEANLIQTLKFCYFYTLTTNRAAYSTYCHISD
jgi:hypothetical protein